MSDPHAQSVYKMLDNLSDTMSWDQLAKELDKYATVNNVDSAVGGETIEMKDLMKSLLEKNPSSSKPD
jgi:hypothetical protein